MIWKATKKTRNFDCNRKIKIKKFISFLRYLTLSIVLQSCLIVVMTISNLIYLYMPRGSKTMSILFFGIKYIYTYISSVDRLLFCNINSHLQVPWFGVKGICFWLSKTKFFFLSITIWVNYTCYINITYYGIRVSCAIHLIKYYFTNYINILFIIISHYTKSCSHINLI